MATDAEGTSMIPAPNQFLSVLTEISPDAAVESPSGLRQDYRAEQSRSWLTRSGATVQIAVRSAACPGPDGNCAGLLMTAGRDPSNETAKLKSRASEATRFRAVIEAAPDAIVKIDSNGSIVLVNRATETLLGYTRDELMGKPVEILVPAAGRGAHAEHRATYKQESSQESDGSGNEAHRVAEGGHSTSLVAP